MPRLSAAEMHAILMHWDEEQSQRDRVASEAFRFDKPAGFDDCALNRELYIHRLTELIHRTGSRRHLSIGALIGTMESFLCQCFRPHLERIVICDVDLASYSEGRDMGAYCYRNICGTRYGDFQKQFIYIRDNSKTERAKATMRVLGQFDTVFVDGEHSRAAVMSDMTIAAECLADGGTIFVHDLELPGDVSQGYRDWLAAHPEWEHAEAPGSHFLLGLGIVQRKR